MFPLFSLLSKKSVLIVILKWSYGNNGIDPPKSGLKAFPTKLISVLACSGLKLIPTIMDIKTPIAMLNQSRRPCSDFLAHSSKYLSFVSTNVWCSLLSSKLAKMKFLVSSNCCMIKSNSVEENLVVGASVSENKGKDLASSCRIDQ